MKLHRSGHSVDAAGPARDVVHAQMWYTHAGRQAGRDNFKINNRIYICIYIYVDWKILVDFGIEQIVFQPELLSTSERPDIIIWSYASRKVLLIELTCPAEEGIDAAKVRKGKKYMDLINQISEHTKWKVSFMTIEVGARGFVGKSLWNCLGKLGFSHSASTKICKSVSLIAAKCSYAIYLASKSRSRDSQQPLLACKD